MDHDERRFYLKMENSASIRDIATVRKVESKLWYKTAFWKFQ